MRWRWLLVVSGLTILSLLSVYNGCGVRVGNGIGGIGGDEGSPGTLDLSFASKGQLLVGAQVDVDVLEKGEYQAMAVQEDGKILAGGTWDGHFILLRYDRDGKTLDSTFNKTGIVTQGFAGAENGISSVMVSSNRITAIGRAGGDKIALVRWDLSGELDQNFGNGGIIVEPTSGYHSEEWGYIEEAMRIPIIEDHHQRIVVALMNDYDIRIVRYTAEGKRDDSFGVNGEVIQAIEQNSVKLNSYVWAAGCDADDNIYVGGYVAAQGSQNGGSMIAKFKGANGDFDLSFGVGGTAIREMTAVGDSVQSLTVFNKQIYVAGQSYNEEGDIRTMNDVYAGRLSLDGQWDSNYGNDGVAELYLDGGQLVGSLVVDSEGRQVISAHNYSLNDLEVYRLTPEGRFDNFGDNGKFAYNFGPIPLYKVRDIGLQSVSGKIIVAGSVGDDHNANLVLLRIWP